MDRVRRLIVAIVVLVVAGLVVLVVTVRPGLREHADALDTSWKPLVAPLDQRYLALHGVVDGLKAAGATDRAVTRQLTAALDRWTVVRTGTDAEVQVESANRLEALAARAAALAHTPRLSENPALRATIAAFDAKRPAGKMLETYQQNVLSYQHDRDGFWSRIVARLDGYPMRPTLQLTA